MQRTINGWVWLSDIAVLLVFAAIGRQNHGESNPISAIISTALPFIIAWSLVGWATNQIHPHPRWQWIWQSALANVLACALGLGLRALWLQRGIPLSFALVALAVTTLFLLIVRLVYSFRSTPRS
jgi:FlaA1/EpsC-like NDP-sugar epimerase